MKKKISLLLCLVMVLQAVVTGGAFAENTGAAQARVIYMNDFGGYMGGTPEGMIKTQPEYTQISAGNSTTDYSATKTETAYHEMKSVTENANTYMSDDNASSSIVSEVVPFGEVIDNGIIHLSADIKLSANTASNNKHITLGLYTNRSDYERMLYENTVNSRHTLEYDLYGDDITKFGVNAEDGSFAPLTRINSVANNGYNAIIDDQEVWCNPNSGSYSAAKAVEAAKWYKYDFLVNIDKGTYSMYIDGEAVGSSTMHANHTFANTDFAGFKGFGIFKQKDVKSYSIDNIYVAHYGGNNKDSIKMMIENPTITDGDKKVEISFSEALASVPSAGDFLINGKSIEGLAVENATKSGATLDFSRCEITENKLIVTTSLVGGVGGTSCEGAEIICTNEASVTEYTYMNENFEGGISGNWYAKTTEEPPGGSKNQYYTNNTIDETDAVLADDAEKGKVMQINGDGMYYFFPRDTATEDFVLEFDVNYSLAEGDGFGIGFIRDADFDILNANGTIFDMYNRSKAFGFIRGSEDTDLLGYFRTSAVTTSAADDWTVNTEAFNDKFLSADQWNHIVIRYKGSEKKLSLCVNNDTERNMAMLPILAYFEGVAGVSFFMNDASDADDAGNVKIDNIKVYRETPYALYQDFNDYKPTYTSYYPAAYSWHTIDAAGIDASKNYYASKSGHSTSSTNIAMMADSTVGAISGPDYNETTNPDDKAVNFSRVDATQYSLVHKFTRSIPEGQPFAIEMDVMYNDYTGALDTTNAKNMVDTMFAISLADELDINYRGEYSTPKDSAGLMSRAVLVKSSGKQSSGTISTSDAATGNLRAYKQTGTPYSGNALLGTNSASTAQLIDIADSDGNVLNMAADKWYNIKMVFAGDRSGYMAYLTDRTTNTTQSAEVVMCNKIKDALNGAVAGLAISTRTIGNAYVYADNLKVYETDESGAEITKASVNSVIGVEAVLADGSEVQITDAIPGAAKKLIVTFSENLKESFKSSEDNFTTTYNSQSYTLTNVYDTVDDVIRFFETGKTYDVDYSAAIDGNKYIIELDGLLDSSKKYTLSIDENTGFASTSLSKLPQSFVKTYSVSADEFMGASINRFEKYVEFGYTEGDTSNEAYWIPVNKIADLAKYPIRYVAEGCNTTGDTVDVLVALAAYEYDENNIPVLSDVVAEIISVGSGNIINLADGLLEQLSYDEADVIKAFIWEKSSVIPLIGAEVID